MDPALPRLRLRAGAAACVALLLGGALACDHATDPPDPGGASYSVEYAPGKLVSATVNCDRLISHAVLSLGRPPTRGFDLSVNVVEDCSRAGGGFAYWEVLILGHYAVGGTQLTFTPDSAATPAFLGSYDFTHVNLTLPVRPDSLAPTPVDVTLGSRSPF